MVDGLLRPEAFEAVVVGQAQQQLLLLRGRVREIGHGAQLQVALGLRVLRSKVKTIWRRV